MLHDMRPETIMNSHAKRELVNAVHAAKYAHEQRQKRIAAAGTVEKLIACRVSEDHGQTWKLFAWCDGCKRTAEPPTLLKNEGVAFTERCEKCGKYNEAYMQEENAR